MKARTLASRLGRELVRDVESGVSAPLRASDLKHAAKSIDDLVAGEAPDATVHVPVATLRLYRAAVCLELLEEGRLLPADFDVADVVELLQGPQPSLERRTELLERIRRCA